MSFEFSVHAWEILNVLVICILLAGFGPFKQPPFERYDRRGRVSPIKNYETTKLAILLSTPPGIRRAPSRWVSSDADTELLDSRR